MSPQQLPGSHLLAALHSQMERMNKVVRVYKAASKTPHSRTSPDIQLIADETQDVLLLNQEGPAVHRELCHVVQALQLKQMESLRLPGDHKSAVFGYVMTGTLQIRAKNKAGFDKAPETNKSSSGGNSSTSVSPDLGPPSPAQGSCFSCSGGVAYGRSMSGAKGSSNGACSRTRTQSKQGNISATEDQLRALFDSIDVDGSGAIDVEELRQALSVMGIDKQPYEVQELMDIVDKDGSGELAFEQFVLVFTNKLGVGCQHEAAWQELPDGTWSLELPEGAYFGEAALLTEEVQDGLILATEDSLILLLDAASYINILKHGFDGQLNAKMSVIRNCPVLASCLSTRSDIRGLAYAAVDETHGWGGQLYAAGEVPTALYVIKEGACKVVATTRTHGAAQLRTSATAGPHSLNADPDSLCGAGGACMLPDSRTAAEAAAAALITSPRHGLHSARSPLTARRTELAMLGPGDIAGEACVLGLTQHISSALVSSASMSVLRMALQDPKQHLHSADLQRVVHTLKQRDEQRQERLDAAAVITCTAASQQQQHRPVAVEDEMTEKAKAAAPNPELLMNGFGIPNGSRSGSHSSNNTTCPRPGLQLPSTAGGAAAAIAAAGGYSPRTDVPSAIHRQREAAVAGMLDGLIAARKVVDTMHSVTVGAALAALQTARAVTVAQSDISMPLPSATSPCTSGSVCDSSGRCSHRQQPHRSASSYQQLLCNRSSPRSDGFGSSHSRSQPGLSRQPGCERTPAGDLMLPLRMQAQRVAVLRDRDRPAECGDSECSRSYRHSRRRIPASTAAAVVNSPRKSPRNSSPGPASGSQANRLHHQTDYYTEAAAPAPVGKAANVDNDATLLPQQRQQVQCSKAAQPTLGADNERFLQSSRRQSYPAPVAAAAVVAAQEMMATSGVNLHSSPVTTPRSSGARQLQATGSHRLSGTTSRAALCTGVVPLESAAGCIKAVIRQQLAATATASNHVPDRTIMQPTSVEVLTPTEVLSDRTAHPSVAKPVALGVFSVVDDAAWSAAETAADATSWLMHRQLKAPRGGSSQRQWQEQHWQAHEVGQKQSCHQQQVLQAGLLHSMGSVSTADLATEGNPVVPQSMLTMHQSMEERANGTVLQDVQLCAPQRQMCEWLAAVRGIPKLPLHEMQQSLVGGTPSKPSSSALSTIKPAGTDDRGTVEHATGCSCGTSAPENSSYQCCSSDPAGSWAAVSSTKNQASLKSCAAGIGSKQHQQHNQQQQAVTTLPAPLPSFRSTLTSKWQPGGRFAPC